MLEIFKQLFKRSNQEVESPVRTADHVWWGVLPVYVKNGKIFISQLLHNEKDKFIKSSNVTYNGNTIEVDGRVSTTDFCIGKVSYMQEHDCLSLYTRRLAQFEDGFKNFIATEIFDIFIIDDENKKDLIRNMQINKKGVKPGFAFVCIPFGTEYLNGDERYLVNLENLISVDKLIVFKDANKLKANNIDISNFLEVDIPKLPTYTELD